MEGISCASILSAGAAAFSVRVNYGSYGLLSDIRYSWVREDFEEHGLSASHIPDTGILLPDTNIGMAVFCTYSCFSIM